jgi:Sel1 repeat-containing protein
MAKPTYILSPSGQKFIHNPTRNKNSRINTSYFKDLILVFVFLDGSYVPAKFKRFMGLFDLFAKPDLHLMPTRPYVEWKHYVDAAKQQLLNKGVLVEIAKGQFVIAPELVNEVHSRISSYIEPAVSQSSSSSSFDSISELGKFWKMWEKGANYFCGNGVPQNYAEAVKWWRVAAEQGDTGSQISLGECYENALGVEISYAEAMKWYGKAAERGNKDAEEKLAALSSKIAKLQ